MPVCVYTYITIEDVCASVLGVGEKGTGKRKRKTANEVGRNNRTWRGKKGGGENRDTATLNRVYERENETNGEGAKNGEGGKIGDPK